MADKRITELNLHTSLELGDVLPIVNSSETKKAALGSVNTFIRNQDTPLTASGIVVSDDILPQIGADITLGSLERPFKELFLQSGSIHIESQQSGELTVDIINNLGNLDISSGGMRLVEPGNSFIAETGSFQYISGSMTQVGDYLRIGNTISTGSTDLSGSFTASLQEGYIWLGDSNNRSTPTPLSSLLPKGLVSGSEQIILGDVTNFTSYSSSVDSILTNLVNATSSYLTSETDSQTLSIVGDQLSISNGNTVTVPSTDISSLNSFTSSYFIDSSSFDTRIDSLTSISGSGFTTGTTEFEELTLERVDGSTQLFDLAPRRVRETIINKDSVTIQKGMPVYVSGSTGNASHVYLADSSNPNRMPATYISDQTLNPDEEGRGLLTGFITGVDTSQFEPGDEVWVRPGGGYQNTRPTGSNILVQKLGNVIDSAKNGSGVIFGAGRSNDVPNIQEGYLWVGNSDDIATPIPSSSFALSTELTSVSSSINTSIDTLTFDQLADVQDYTASAIPHGYLPVWNTGSQEWRPGRPDFEQGKTRLFVAASRSNSAAFFFNSQTRTSDTSASPAPDSAFMLVSGDLDTIIVHLRSDTNIDVTIDIFKNANGVAFSSATSTVTPITRTLTADTITSTTFSGVTINQFDSIHIKITPTGGGNFYGIVEIV